MPESLPILDRQPHFDEESRNYSIRRLLGGSLPLRKRLWAPGRNVLDQGQEGRCVVFGWGNELAASPNRYNVDTKWCNDHWPMVQDEDHKMGNFWDDGASVLAGAKAMQRTGALNHYAWAFGIDDVLQTLMRRGPVVLGINWYSSMYRTNSDGLVNVSGNIVGGHCILANGIWPRHPVFGTDVVVWTNSWGPEYGINGRGYITVSDLDRLLRENGEAVIPTDTRVKL